MIKEEIKANNLYLFDLTQDYEQRKQWDSLMKSAELLTPAPVGKGSQLRYTTYTGMSMLVQYCSYKRGKIASINMINDDWLLKKFAGGWRFNFIDEHTTEVIFAYSFEIKIFPKLMNTIFAYFFRWENKRRINKLKKFAERSYTKNKVL